MSPRKPEKEKYKTPVSIRLSEFFGQDNFTDISKKTGISSTTIGQQLQGVISPSVKLLSYIANNGGDTNYILSGKRYQEDGKASLQLERIYELEEQVLNLKSQLNDKNEIIELQREKLGSISNNSDLSKTVEEIVDIIEQRRASDSSSDSTG